MNDPVFSQDLLGPAGWTLLPLILCSVAACAVILDRLLAMPGCRGLGRADRHRMEEALAAGRVEQALEQVLAARPFFTAAVLVLRDMAADPKDLRDEAASLALRDDARRLTRRRSALVTLAGLAPMLGLLGTVVGMMLSFQAVEAIDGPVSPAVVAGGLWQAMITTGVGLAVAVPCMVMAAWVKSWARLKVAEAAAILTLLSIALERRQRRERAA